MSIMLLGCTVNTETSVCTLNSSQGFKMFKRPNKNITRQDIQSAELSQLLGDYFPVDLSKFLLQTDVDKSAKVNSVNLVSFSLGRSGYKGVECSSGV